MNNLNAIAPQSEHALVIAAEARQLYHLVTDVTRAPEWLPSVRSARLVEPSATILIGARFEVRLRSRRRHRVFEVLVAEPARAFQFAEVRADGQLDSTRWNFAFSEVPGGTRVTCCIDAGSHNTEDTENTGAIGRRLLEAISRTAEGRSRVTQPRLGQVHTAEGPLDLSAMFLMHHGFRRDFRDLVNAVPATPMDAVEVWQALARRWKEMSTALHHHHQVEDQALWPPLLARVLAVGDEEGVQALQAMTAEHGRLDPSLRQCAEGFSAMVSAPSADIRDRLVTDLIEARGALTDHLAHEETAAVPLIQTHMSVADWKDFEAGARREYGLTGIGFAAPWSVLEVPDDQLKIAYAHGGALIRVILAVTSRSFLRGHRTAFRYLPVASGVTDEASARVEV